MANVDFMAIVDAVRRAENQGMTFEAMVGRKHLNRLASAFDTLL